MGPKLNRLGKDSFLLTKGQIEQLIPSDLLEEERLRDFLIGEVLDYLHWVAYEKEPLAPDAVCIVLNVLNDAHHAGNELLLRSHGQLAENLWLLKRLFPKGSLGSGG